jgi:lipopolysaccharide/colanic/teichoic acid biosynthesis glycosyltransferase
MTRASVHPGRNAVQRAFDVVASSVALVLALPLLAAAALGIKLADPGPVLFRAQRVGRDGRPFAMLKFRTMRVRADHGPRITVPDDARVFPFGRWLRRTKIDELPQLVNVLRGEMSVIGPRPEDPALLAAADPALVAQVCSVRPGLAGPGALYHDTLIDPMPVDGDPDSTYVRTLLTTKLQLDLEYVRQASLAYDLRLIVRTLAVIATRLLGRRRFSDPPELVAMRQARGFGSAQPGRALTLVLALTLAFTLALGGVGIAARFQTHDIQLPPWRHRPDAVVLVGAGDISDCRDDADAQTAALLDSIPGTVFTTGDHAYPDGSLDRFRNCFDATWGRHLDRIRPSPGNRDYRTAGAAGYFAYFGDRAGSPDRGYYAYRLGAWRAFALNSEVPMHAGSAQHAWLREQLAATPESCILAYWHRPRFSSGALRGHDDTTSADVWAALYAAGADLVLAGHEHFFERFAPQAPSGEPDDAYGIRQFTVGTGGAERYRFGRAAPNSEVRRTGTPGVLALRLADGRYAWQFVSAGRDTFSDSGSAACHPAPPTRVSGATPAPMPMEAQ